MSRPDLESFQAGFAAALLARDPAARPAGLTPEAAARFRVYRNSVHYGLSQQLAEAYPVVRRLVGEDFFRATAREYLAGHPPRGRSLALFGEAFPGFLAEFPPADSVPYLADVARLERARLEALHAADTAPLAPADVNRLGPALAEAAFEPHPAARVVVSDHPIVDLWQANRPEAEAGPRTIAAVPQGAFITRPRAQVLLRKLTPAQAVFAERLLSGDHVAAAVEQAGRGDPRFEVTAAFRALLSAGAFARLRA
ncbi:MAG: DNA-binding domain-containing protein [Kiloniellales bacterium]|nr:DNA-binding domain-containing protein [Kiloniellales bacterium]